MLQILFKVLFYLPHVFYFGLFIKFSKKRKRKRACGYEYFEALLHPQCYDLHGSLKYTISPSQAKKNVIDP